MDDLKFPIFNEPLPPPKRMGNEAYLAFVMWYLDHMAPEERKRQLARRPVPTGKKFTLFPKDLL